MRGRQPLLVNVTGFYAILLDQTYRDMKQVSSASILIMRLKRNKKGHKLDPIFRHEWAPIFRPSKITANGNVYAKWLSKINRNDLIHPSYRDFAMRADQWIRQKVVSGWR